MQTPIYENNVVLSCEQCGGKFPLSDSELKQACERCGHRFQKLKSRSLSKTLAFSVTALIFYFPAMSFPFMTMELYGSRSTATIWDGVVSLGEAGSWFIAIIVFLASILIPILKLAVLFYLSSPLREATSPYSNTQLYRFVEYIGRWSMLDIFLLAVLVAILKLGPWTSVEPRIGALMFAFVVIFTMLASASFDSRLLWSSQDE